MPPRIYDGGPTSDVLPGGSQSVQRRLHPPEPTNRAETVRQPSKRRLLREGGRCAAPSISGNLPRNGQ